MTIFIGHISALQFLLQNGSVQRALGTGIAVPDGYLSQTRAKPQPRSKPDYSAVSLRGFPDGVCTHSLHVNVADRYSLSQSRCLTCHNWPAPEKGSYLTVDDLYCVATPEACFLQLSAALPFPHLVELGFILCGTFAPGSDSGSCRYGLAPLTSPKKLSEYAQRMSGRSGAERARSALRYVSANAGSPMEAKLAVMLALPTRFGGYGIPALLNPVISLPDESRGAAARKTRRPDFFWPDRGVVLDYDGRAFHDLPNQVTSDSVRRNSLSSLELKCFTARSEDVRSVDDLEKLMGQVMRALGRYRKSTVPNLSDRRGELHRLLFTPEAQFQPMRSR